MSAYLIVFVDVHDEERFASEYIPPIMGTLKPFGGQVLCARDENVVVEGSMPKGRTVLMEFPDMENALGWYNSDDYAPLIELRQQIATTNVAFVEGGIPQAA